MLQKLANQIIAEKVTELRGRIKKIDDEKAKENEPIRINFDTVPSPPDSRQVSVRPQPAEDAPGPKNESSGLEDEAEGNPEAVEEKKVGRRPEEKKSQPVNRHQHNHDRPHVVPPPEPQPELEQELSHAPAQADVQGQDQPEQSPLAEPQRIEEGDQIPKSEPEAPPETKEEAKRKSEPAPEIKAETRPKKEEETTPRAVERGKLEEEARRHEGKSDEEKFDEFCRFLECDEPAKFRRKLVGLVLPFNTKDKNFRIEAQMPPPVPKRHKPGAKIPQEQIRKEIERINRERLDKKKAKQREAEEKYEKNRRILKRIHDQQLKERMVTLESLNNPSGSVPLPRDDASGSAILPDAAADRTNSLSLGTSQSQSKAAASQSQKLTWSLLRNLSYKEINRAAKAEQFLPAEFMNDSCDPDELELMQRLETKLSSGYRMSSKDEACHRTLDPTAGAMKPRTNHNVSAAPESVGDSLANPMYYHSGVTVDRCRRSTSRRARTTAERLGRRMCKRTGTGRE